VPATGNKRSGPASPTTTGKAISLRELSAHLGLSQTTVSVVLNESPVADSIRQETKERIFEAARQLGYRPNFVARALRKQRSFTVGVLIPYISDGYPSKILSGIEDFLASGGFAYFAMSHHRSSERLAKYSQLLVERAVEGLIFIDTTFTDGLPLPTVAIAGHQNVEGVTNVVLDHRRAVHLALTHLKSLGHKRIAFMRGQPFSTDSATRWNSICEVAKELQIQIRPELVMQLEEEIGTPQVGYPVMKAFLARKHPFTALFAYNDISAIGAMRALADEGISVPNDVSVVGFDDIDAAAFQTPSLTTVRQPLHRMGEIAAQLLLQRLNSTDQDYPHEIAVEPELVVRESTAPVK
jgi:LacI family transcriptional regulator